MLGTMRQEGGKSGDIYIARAGEIMCRFFHPRACVLSFLHDAAAAVLDLYGGGG